jgi:hypothetical protein
MCISADYSCVPLPQQNVRVEDDPGFLISCDCSDGCASRKKCACIQLTIQVTHLCSIFKNKSTVYLKFTTGSFRNLS